MDLLRFFLTHFMNLQQMTAKFAITVRKGVVNISFNFNLIKKKKHSYNHLFSKKDF